MKIVCDACQAKYSISDDKVQGKVFKIRCKKCSNIIVVRGGANAAEPAAAPVAEKETRVYDYGYEGGDQAPAGDDAVWHVVINQDQVGPMTAAEVQQKFAAGEIDGETYIWREGFSDWLPMSQVDTFAAFVASGNTTAAVSSSSGSGASAVAAMFGGGAGGDDGGTVRSDPGDLFAAASGGVRGGAADDDGDLFGSKPGTGGGQAAASSAGSSSSKLRGERNENSVLFSLGNLAQLASDKPAPAPAASSASSSSGHATGAAGGEGSGLIDIRSMATAYRGGPGGAAKPAAASAGVGSIDDLPVFSGGGFAEPAVIMPTSRPQRDNKMMYILIGAVGLLAVAAIILVVVLVKGDGDKKSTANTVASADEKDDSDKKDEDADKPDETKPDEAKAPTPPADENKGSAEQVAKADPEPADTKTETPKDTKASAPKETTRPRESTRGSTRDSRSSGTTAVAPKETVKPPADGGCDEVSCVLSNYEGACCAKFKKGGSKGASKPSSGGGGDLPEQLDRSMISEGVAKVKARVISCGDKSSAKGDVKVKVKVNPDGSVGNVSITTSPDGALGSCVASAMQRASFKRTKVGGTFSYPFKF